MKASQVAVYGKGGWQGALEEAAEGVATTGGEVWVRLDSGERLAVTRAVLEAQPDGRFYVPFSLEELRADRVASDIEADTTVIPVVEERLDIGRRREVSGGVRVTKDVHNQEVVVDEPIFQDEVDVERVPIDRFVEVAPDVRYEGDTMIIPVLEEVLVTEIRLRLKEELRVTRRTVERREPQTFTLRREEATVERVEAPNLDNSAPASE